MKKTKSTVNYSLGALKRIRYAMILTFSFNIENINDENKIPIVDFELNDFVIFIEGNRLNRKWEKLFSKQNVLLKE
jgi:hypothetical protein